MESAAFTGFIIFLGFIGGFVSAFLAGKVAHTKGWSGFAWGVAGFLFGPLGLIAAAGLPDRRLRHYLRELSLLQGVSLDALEQEPSRDERQDAQENGHADFTTKLYASDAEIWDAILDVLPQRIKESAKFEQSDMRGNQGRLIVRAEDGRYLCEANIGRSEGGLTSWKLSNRS